MIVFSVPFLIGLEESENLWVRTNLFDFVRLCCFRNYKFCNWIHSFLWWAWHFEKFRTTFAFLELAIKTTWSHINKKLETFRVNPGMANDRRQLKWQRVICHSWEEWDENSRRSLIFCCSTKLFFSYIWSLNKPSAGVIIETKTGLRVIEFPTFALFIHKSILLKLHLNQFHF